MHIALHMATLRGFGSRAVGRGLLAALSQTQKHQFTAWIPDSWDPLSPPAEDARVTLHSMKGGILSKLHFEHLRLHRALESRRFDVLFSLGDTSLTACNTPHLLLVQQAYLASDLSLLDFRIPAPFFAKISLMQAYFRAGIPGVDRFTVQTDFMKTKLEQRWSIPSEKIVVIPSAIAPLPDPLPEPSRFPWPHLCYISSPSAHKNFALLPEVLSHLKGPHADLKIHLTVTSQSVPELVAKALRLGVLDRFVFHGPISWVAALSLTRGALVSIIPSKLESFGLPYHEAMGLGSPIVAADLPFAREACQDAAHYAPPNSGEVFATLIARLADDPSLRASLSNAGLQRFQKNTPSWSEIAQRYLRSLKEISA